ncbi:hypothetical protein AMJ86_10585 [bacterium SM23_57]|nr:MAG: hypothetical protein AMJ86_10585 [bacterium SM23_57]
MNTPLLTVSEISFMIQSQNHRRALQRTCIASSVILLCFILVASAWSIDSFRNRSISGTIAAGIHHQKIQGAEVIAIATDDETSGGFALSGPDGTYRIGQLRPGNYWVHVLLNKSLLTELMICKVSISH